jgi:hypothetical protein
VVPLPYRILIGLAGLAAVAFYAYRGGYSAADERNRVEQLEQAVAYAEAYQKEVERGDKIAKQLAEANRTRQRTNTRLVVRTADLAGCGHPPGSLVRLHDSAASSTALLESSRESSCSPSTVGYDQFARVLVENYGLCNGYRDQLNALISFYERDQ